MGSEPYVPDEEILVSAFAGYAPTGAVHQQREAEARRGIAKIKADAVQAAVDEFARQPGLTTKDWLVVRWFEEHIEQIEGET